MTGWTMKATSCLSACIGFSSIRQPLPRRVLAVLRDETDYTVLTDFAARLAGELRLEAAVPYLTEMLTKGDEGLSEECHWALIRIGTVSVVEHLTQSYRDSDPIQRLSIPSILENIHSDVSVKACLAFLATERDPSMRGYLIQAILHNCSSEGIEPAPAATTSLIRQLILVCWRSDQTC